jgi:hypothetical protein
MKKVLGLLVLVFGVACASTAYRANQGRSGGYQDQQIDETTFAVKFYANHSNDLKTRNNLLLRCAMLTTAHGYTYFNAVGPINGNSNEMDVVIRLSNSRVPASYDAVMVQERFANLVNCGKAKPPAVNLVLPGLGKPCQGKLALAPDLLDANVTKP